MPGEGGWVGKGEKGKEGREGKGSTATSFFTLKALDFEPKSQHGLGRLEYGL